MGRIWFVAGRLSKRTPAWRQGRLSAENNRNGNPPHRNDASDRMCKGPRPNAGSVRASKNTAFVRKIRRVNSAKTVFGSTLIGKEVPENVVRGGNSSAKKAEMV